MPLAGSASHSTWPPPASSPLVPLSGWLASARADRSGEESAGCAMSGGASAGGGRGCSGGRPSASGGLPSASGGLPPASWLAPLMLPEDEQAARRSVVARQELRRSAFGIVRIRASAGCCSAPERPHGVASNLVPRGSMIQRNGCLPAQDRASLLSTAALLGWISRRIQASNPPPTTRVASRAACRVLG